MNNILKFAVSLIITIGLTACATGINSFSSSTVSDGIEKRTGLQLPSQAPISTVLLPDGVDLTHALDLDQLALIALWNNANFKTLLVDMKLAQADLEQAGLLPNPEMLYGLQSANKPFKYALELPIETIWLRPMRLKVASAEAERVSHVIQQAGLDLIRDVRQSSVELATLRQQRQILEQSNVLRGEISALTDQRLELGDISESEALVKRADAARALQDGKKSGYEVQFAEQRLLLLLGLKDPPEPLNIKVEHHPSCDVAGFDIDKVINAALTHRPDLAAAADSIQVSKNRENLSKFSWLRLLGIADATSGQSGHELGPAVRFTLPIFNWNRPNINRSSSEVEKAERVRQALIQQATADLRQQFTRYQQSCTELDILNAQLKPLADMASVSATASYENGDISYLAMLESRKQLMDIQLQEAILQGAIYKAWLEIDRGSGNQLTNIIPVSPMAGLSASKQ